MREPLRTVESWGAQNLLKQSGTGLDSVIAEPAAGGATRQADAPPTHGPASDLFACRTGLESQPDRYSTGSLVLAPKTNLQCATTVRRSFVHLFYFIF